MPLVILGLIVASSASVKMVALVTGSAAVSAPLDGMEYIVRSQVCASEPLKTGDPSSNASLCSFVGGSQVLPLREFGCGR